MSLLSKTPRVARSLKACLARVVVRNSSTETGKAQAPNLPGLSMDQIRKIGETDTSLRTRHIQIEGEMSDEERDTARVSLLHSIHRLLALRCTPWTTHLLISTPILTHQLCRGRE